MWQDQITNQSTKAIMEGKLFCGGHIFAALASAATANIRLTTGAYPAMVDFILTAMGKCSVTPYKGTTYTADGNPVVMNNRNLGSVLVPAALIHETPTVNVLGTACSPILVPGSSGGGVGGQKIGAGFNDDYGFYLPANTDILFAITNNSGAAIDVNPVFVVSEIR